MSKEKVKSKSHEVEKQYKHKVDQIEAELKEARLHVHRLTKERDRIYAEVISLI